MKRIVLRIFVALLALTTVRLAVAGAGEELLRMNRAAAELSYEGVFITVSGNKSGNKVEAMQVVHQVKEMMMKERLYALNGAPREVVRDADRVWCFIPDKNTGVHEYRQASESGFPRILPGNLSSLAGHYRFELGDMDRVAGRSARQISILSLDGYRYGYNLWADEETGLLLRSDLLDSDGGVIEQYMFVEIRIGDVADEKLQAVTAKQDLEWFGNGKPQWAVDKQPSAWRIERLPPGFTQSRHIFRMSPMNSRPMEHFVFADGLASVSTFIKAAATPGQSAVEGPSGMGSIHAFSRNIDGYRVTVMGEVPAATVAFIADAVVHQPAQ